MRVGCGHATPACLEASVRTQQHDVAALHAAAMLYPPELTLPSMHLPATGSAVGGNGMPAQCAYWSTLMCWSPMPPQTLPVLVLDCVSPV